MASRLSGNRGKYRAPGRHHPVDAGLLLALIRGQRLENEAFVRQHLAACEQCRQVYAGLEQTSRTLDVLEQVARYQRYPELSLETVQARARQSPARRPIRVQGAAPVKFDQPRPQRSSMRWVSLPVAIVLILMTVVIVIALALVQFNSVDVLRFPSGSGRPAVISPVSSTGTGLQPLRPSPTQGVGATGTTTVTPSPASTKPTGPYIAGCPTPYRQDFDVAVCGYLFPAGDSVELYVATYANSKLTPLFKTTVNKNGQFLFNWRVIWCRDDPTVVFAVDRTSSSVINSNKLTDLYVRRCFGPGPTPTPSPSPSATPGTQH
jgi:hypothetical protein